MQSVGRLSRYLGRCLAILAVVLLGAAPVAAADPDPVELARAIVRIAVKAPPDSLSARTLGAEREGSGAVIDGSGLILTIGYIVMEAAEITVTDANGKAYPAELVAYDHITGFGLVRAGFGFDAPPVRLGDSAALKTGDIALVLARGGPHAALPVVVVARREFAGYWEYLLEDAIFTAPLHPGYGGAALLDSSGRLVGIGSLFIRDAVPGKQIPGNMFVPVSALEPVFGDLLAYGRRQGAARPWLGVSVREEGSGLLVERVTPGGPAESAGVRPGDRIVGIGDDAFTSLAEFYRKIWALGPAGVQVPLRVLRGQQMQPTTVISGDRYQYLRLNPTY